MIKLLAGVVITLLSMSVAAKSIVVLGDSISAGYGIETGQGWVDLLQKKLDGHTVYNESISGDTSAGGVARIDKVLERYQPDLVLLELGANDGLRGLSPAEMKANLVEIIRRVRGAGAKVLLLGMKIPPNYGKRYVDMFYTIYPQVAEELDVPLVPFILEDVVLDPDKMQTDGLHPNAKAQPIIADKIAAYVLPLLE